MRIFYWFHGDRARRCADALRPAFSAGPLALGPPIGIGHRPSLLPPISNIAVRAADPRPVSNYSSNTNSHHNSPGTVVHRSSHTRVSAPPPAPWCCCWSRALLLLPSRPPRMARRVTTTARHTQRHRGRILRPARTLLATSTSPDTSPGRRRSRTAAQPVGAAPQPAIAACWRANASGP